MAELKDLKKSKSVFFFCKYPSGKVFGMYNVFLDFFLVKTRIFFFFRTRDTGGKKITYKVCNLDFGLHTKYVILFKYFAEKKKVGFFFNFFISKSFSLSSTFSTFSNFSKLGSESKKNNSRRN
jgi:hypothetical protein